MCGIAGIIHRKCVFSPANPYRARLDTAYRALEAEERSHNCASCHSPDNRVQMNPLRLLNYPNQALTVRHDIVRRVEQNSMPPGGIPDEGQRRKLRALAKQFAALGDQALDCERGLKPLQGLPVSPDQ